MGYSLEQMKNDMLKMWLWLSENPKKGKYLYLNEHPEVICGKCPTCHYDDIILEGDCECPFPWDGVDVESECGDKGSYHNKWCESKTPHGKSIYAKEIYKLALQIKVK